MESDAKQILERMVAEWKQAAEARDLDRLLSLISDDCVFIAPAAPPVLGKEAASNMFKTVWSRVKEHHQNFAVEEAFISGDCLIAWGRDSATMVPAGEGEPIEFGGHGMMILTRQPDGSWKFARGINNMMRVSS